MKTFGLSGRTENPW